MRFGIPKIRLQKPAFTTENWLFTWRLFGLFLAPPRLPHSNGSCRSSSTICAYAQTAIPPLNNPQRLKMELALYNPFQKNVSKGERQMPQSMFICAHVSSQPKRYVQAWKDLWSQVNCFHRARARCGCKGTLF